MKKYIKIINIVLLVICMISIFLLSSEDRKTSTDRSIDTTKKIVYVVSEEKTESEVNSFAIKNFVKVRKSAHFIEYLCLGILVINVIKDYRKINIGWLIIGIVFCILYAVSDEVHQIYVPGRSCEIKDICIDSIGSIIGTVILFFKLK